MNETGKQGYNRTETEPTQAQIEAAAGAICKSATCEGINCCQWPANGGKRRDSRGQPVQCNVKLGAYDDAAQAALTAAAEAGEHSAIDAFNKGYKQAWDNATAATIERCAQEAERYDEVGAVIAAAIRAMKEKP